MADLTHYDQKNLFGSDTFLSQLLEKDDLCFTVQREISPLVKDSDFEEMYRDGGRPPVSPRLLVLVLLMQFLESLSDRAAIRNLKFRLDWKIAFGLPVDFAGFHATTLVYFRERLISHEKSCLVFDKILEHLRICGLVKSKGKQRIDSTHVLAAVQELTRIELLHETLRLFCESAAEVSSLMDDSLLKTQEKYIEKISSYRSTAEEKAELIRQAGLAMRSFIEWTLTLTSDNPLRLANHFITLKLVFEQNFTDKGSSPELIKVATGKGHICNPHDPDAEYANKGKKSWLGYKVQVAETVNSEGIQNFITHIELETATSFDGNCVEKVIAALESKQIVPAELYGDTHYNTSENIELLQVKNIDLKGEVIPITNHKQEKDLGFNIQLEKQSVICPAGIESKHFHVDPSGRVKASFPKLACLKCQRRDICQPQPRGKIFEQRPENTVLTLRRKKMKDPDYKKDLHHRNGVEGTISGLVRGQKLRKCRYKGKAKSQLQTKMIGAAANVSRLAAYRWRENRAKEAKCA